MGLMQTEKAKLEQGVLAQNVPRRQRRQGEMRQKHTLIGNAQKL